MISTVDNRSIVTTVNAKIIEMILSREKDAFDDFIFNPSTWEDAFIAELLKWIQRRYWDIPLKHHNFKDKNYDNNWKTFYEQIARIIYYFVIYKNLQDSKQLIYNIFIYLFNNSNYSSYNNIINKLLYDNSHKHHYYHDYDDYEMITSEKIIIVYNYVIKKIPHELYKHHTDIKDREPIDLLIGRWKTKEMENKLERIVITINNINNDEKISVNIVDDCDYSDNYSSDVCDYTDSDFYISSDSGDE